jgi:DNA-binding GntR family transcriptional regulator
VQARGSRLRETTEIRKGVEVPVLRPAAARLGEGDLHPLRIVDEGVALALDALDDIVAQHVLRIGRVERVPSE